MKVAPGVRISGRVGGHHHHHRPMRFVAPRDTGRPWLATLPPWRMPIIRNAGCFGIFLWLWFIEFGALIWIYEVLIWAMAWAGIFAFRTFWLVVRAVRHRGAARLPD